GLQRALSGGPVRARNPLPQIKSKERSAKDAKDSNEPSLLGCSVGNRRSLWASAEQAPLYQKPLRVLCVFRGPVRLLFVQEPACWRSSRPARLSPARWLLHQPAWQAPVCARSRPRSRRLVARAAQAKGRAMRGLLAVSGQSGSVAHQLLPVLPALLRVEAQGGDRTRLEALDAD